MIKIQHAVFAACMSSAIFMSVILKNYIIERYFFDTLLYQKSETHGYFSGNAKKDTALKRDRMDGFDIWVKGESNPDKSKFSQKNGPYHIAVIGDSLVWGQGIKKEQRFADILERKIRTSRSVEVLSLGMGGDNLIDHLSKYQLLSKNSPQDLYIFLLYNNDALIWPELRYPTTVARDIKETCAGLGPFIYDGTDLTKGITAKDNEANMAQAWKQPSNRCVARESIRLLPKNAIYFIVTNITGPQYSEPIEELLTQSGRLLYRISLDESDVTGIQTLGVRKDKTFTVTRLEGHPSALANQMIADYLFTLIQLRNRW